MIKIRDFSLGTEMGKIICNGCNKPYDEVKEIAERERYLYAKVLYLCDDCYKEYNEEHQVKAHL